MKKTQKVEKQQQILRAELNFTVLLHRFLFVNVCVELFFFYLFLNTFYKRKKTHTHTQSRQLTLKLCDVTSQLKIVVIFTGVLISP